MHAHATELRVGYILGLLKPNSVEPEWLTVAVELVEPDTRGFLWSTDPRANGARVFGASENVGGLIFFLAAKGYRVVVERVGVLA